MMSLMNVTAVAPSSFLIGLASIHLVNLSTATRRCVMPPRAVLKGPTMSRPQTAKGQVMGIVLRAAEGVCFCRLKRWQPLQYRTILLRVVGDGWPVEAVAERLGRDVLGAGVVATLALVDLLEESASFLWVDAAHEDAGDAALVELAVDDGVGASPALDLPSHDLVLW